MNSNTLCTLFSKNVRTWSTRICRTTNLILSSMVKPFVSGLQRALFTCSGNVFDAPAFSTSSKVSNSTPRFLAFWFVDGRVPRITIIRLRHFGDLSSSWLHFSSVSTTTTDISAKWTTLVYRPTLRLKKN